MQCHVIVLDTTGTRYARQQGPCYRGIVPYYSTSSSESYGTRHCSNIYTIRRVEVTMIVQSKCTVETS